MKDYAFRQCLALLEPVGFVWGGLVLLTIILFWRRQRLAGVVAAALALLMFVVGSTGLPGWLVRGLEKPYAGVQPGELPAVDAIVMLGGGSEPSRYEVGGMHLTYAADRLVMAMELARLRKAPRLILGGAGVELDGKARLESEVVRNWMTERAYVSVEVIALERCSNTHDEATQVAAMAKKNNWKSVLLVTSANHMRRAAATFRTEGVEVVPAPCNFLTQVSLASSPFSLNVPGAGGFMKMSVWLHEQVGWVMYQRRGWIDPAKIE